MSPKGKFSRGSALNSPRKSATNSSNIENNSVITSVLRRELDVIDCDQSNEENGLHVPSSASLMSRKRVKRGSSRDNGSDDRETVLGEINVNSGYPSGTVIGKQNAESMLTDVHKDSPSKSRPRGVLKSNLLKEKTNSQGTQSNSALSPFVGYSNEPIRYKFTNIPPIADYLPRSKESHTKSQKRDRLFTREVSEDVSIDLEDINASEEENDINTYSRRSRNPARPMNSDGRLQRNTSETDRKSFKVMARGKSIQKRVEEFNDVMVELEILDQSGKKFRVICKNGTKIAKIAESYCKQENIDKDSIVFFLDGERLKLHCTVAYYDIVQGDTIEVFTRTFGGYNPSRSRKLHRTSIHN